MWTTRPNQQHQRNTLILSSSPKSFFRMSHAFIHIRTLKSWSSFSLSLFHLEKVCTQVIMRGKEKGLLLSSIFFFWCHYYAFGAEMEVWKGFFKYYTNKHTYITDSLIRDTLSHKLLLLLLTHTLNFKDRHTDTHAEYFYFKKMFFCCWRYWCCLLAMKAYTYMMMMMVLSKVEKKKTLEIGRKMNSYCEWSYKNNVHVKENIHKKL